LLHWVRNSPADKKIPKPTETSGVGGVRGERQTCSSLPALPMKSSKFFSSLASCSRRASSLLPPLITTPPDAAAESASTVLGADTDMFLFWGAGCFTPEGRWLWTALLITAPIAGLMVPVSPLSRFILCAKSSSEQPLSHGCDCLGTGYLGPNPSKTANLAEFHVFGPGTERQQLKLSSIRLGAHRLEREGERWKEWLIEEVGGHFSGAGADKGTRPREGLKALPLRRRALWAASPPGKTSRHPPLLCTKARSGKQERRGGSTAE
jgi:hypothetical protein